MTLNVKQNKTFVSLQNKQKLKNKNNRIFYFIFLQTFFLCLFMFFFSRSLFLDSVNVLRSEKKNLANKNGQYG